MDRTHITACYGSPEVDSFGEVDLTAGSALEHPNSGAIGALARYQATLRNRELALAQELLFLQRQRVLAMAAHDRLLHRSLPVPTRTG